VSREALSGKGHGAELAVSALILVPFFYQQGSYPGLNNPDTSNPSIPLAQENQL
jgi:hypothetical protein